MPRSRGLQVLLVEDDWEAAESLAQVLRRDGHGVQVAGDGAAALAEARSVPPDVVLIALGLPGMDGFSVAKRLHDQFAWRRPLLVAVSGQGGPEACRCSVAAGIDLHLVKPVEPAKLLFFLRRFGAVLDGIEGFDPTI
jgi:DNA-binding response OmpR family regulator